MTDQSLQPPHILIFDSGVGGLSVLAAVRARLPAARYTYASDNGFFPYGTKSAVELVPRVADVLARLQRSCAPDLLVIACNTASTVALPVLRACIEQPVVGVVPAIKPAAAQSRSGVIGLLATPATVERAYTQQLIDDFAGRCTVRRLGSSELVALAEAKLRGATVDSKTVRAIIAPLFAGSAGAALDTVVLACTHFPLLGPELAAAVPHPVAWIDSGAAVARRVAALLEQSGRWPVPAPDRPPAIDAAPPGDGAIFTAKTANIAALVPALARFGLGPPSYL